MFYIEARRVEQCKVVWLQCIHTYVLSRIESNLKSCEKCAQFPPKWCWIQNNSYSFSALWLLGINNAFFFIPFHTHLIHFTPSLYRSRLRAWDHKIGWLSFFTSSVGRVSCDFIRLCLCVMYGYAWNYVHFDSNDIDFTLVQTNFETSTKVIIKSIDFFFIRNKIHITNCLCVIRIRAYYSSHTRHFYLIFAV